MPDCEGDTLLAVYDRVDDEALEDADEPLAAGKVLDVDSLDGSEEAEGERLAVEDR